MALPPSLGCFGAGARGPGALGLAPVVATAFSTYKSPKFYLSFTILVSFILVKYPDRIGLVNTVPWYLRYRTVGRYLRYIRQSEQLVLSRSDAVKVMACLAVGGRKYWPQE